VSYSVDVNLLLYASDRASPHHSSAFRFLEERRSQPELFCIAWPTLMSYLRIATHPSIFAEPLSPAEALGNVAALLGLRQVRAISEQEDFLRAYREVAGRSPIRGNLVPDAHLAAILWQHGVRMLYTSDADFRRFDFLEIRDPLT
jgi:toxin-antitoxin system PIN domain toxin